MATVTVTITTDEYQNTPDFIEAVKALLNQQHLYLGNCGEGIYFDPIECDRMLEYKFRYEFKP